jgi:hypothetical protein
MRSILPAILLLTACSDQAATPSIVGLFAGEGRDVLCIAGPAGQQRGAFIAYGDGNNNCSARGRVEAEGAGWALVPSGEGECRIPFSMSGDRIALGAGHPSCSYYCGPRADYAGKSFRRADPAAAAAAPSNPMVDFAGEPLC